jgi:hypothetical protein
MRVIDVIKENKTVTNVFNSLYYEKESELIKTAQYALINSSVDIGP